MSSMKLSKMNRALEIFWWVMAGVTLIMVVIMIFVDGWDKWSFYLLAPILCIVLALVRRFMAKRLAKSEAYRDSQKKAKA